VTSVAPSRATVLLRGERDGEGDDRPRDPPGGSRADRPSSPSTAPPSRDAARVGAVRPQAGAFTGAVEERKAGSRGVRRHDLLDEVGDIPLPTQVKLLRVLQERTFERLGENRPVSVDSGSSRRRTRPRKDGRGGTFREDLYYRLNVIPVFLPPLRDRKETSSR